ncbi:delta-1-pyrroline-5-carboxylate dehydrogenase, mitochondrial-like isoform X2 [Xenia sp. Carnegie-2017]|uniref:delta-1-pyrroline-5-carboxylate dehydrogenase, mitochondrial-like isoform X2 n=1 Tax=Xenia sp. Carnegie-2017 TaxID=2897299 RepID=UPI001F04FC41|nr:delta-1-pyrroline-5-carboxylate dehydrogenase, mitochondrial-like isoform X2 [Xenia sp. Carnegie-2017]
MMSTKMIAKKFYLKWPRYFISRWQHVSSFPVNEPSTDLTDISIRTSLLNELYNVENKQIEIPCVVDGKKIFTGNVAYQILPYRHENKVAKVHLADEKLINKAIDSSLLKRNEWEILSQDERSSIFTNAATLLTTKYRLHSLALTMAGQAKVAMQADIDCVAELADFLRFNAHYAKGILDNVELIQFEKEKNSMTARGLEGFIAAISPFNFTAIGGNLATGPATLGNVVLWKPSLSSMIASWSIYEILEEAGLPPGVINFLPSHEVKFGNTVTSSPHMAGLSFVGSERTFKALWKQVGNNIDIYRTFPRLSGECGGKNFHFVHESADIDLVVNSTIRSAFEYSGQKCSACGRMYVPDTIWPQIREKLLDCHKDVKMGEPSEFSNFMSSVINKKAFESIKGFIDYAKKCENVIILAGGISDDRVGYYIEPTIMEVKDPKDKLMTEEIFGPVLPIYVYKADMYRDILKMIDETSKFALTGAVFSESREVIREVQQVLRQAAGNFYINDKCTGSVVAQQPFGGRRMSDDQDTG